MKTLIALTIVLFANVAHAQDVFIPKVTSVTQGKAEYKLCMQTLQEWSNMYSKCAGRLIERRVLAPEFTNLPVERWLAGSRLELPNNVTDIQYYVAACSHLRAHTGVHLQACWKGL